MSIAVLNAINITTNIDAIDIVSKSRSKYIFDRRKLRMKLAVFFTSKSRAYKSKCCLNHSNSSYPNRKTKKHLSTSITRGRIHFYSISRIKTLKSYRQSKQKTRRQVLEQIKSRILICY